MKILVLGDPHFKLDLPYADRIADRRKEERAESLRFIHEQAKDCDAVVLMGDNLDKRHNHSSVIKEFVDFLDGFGEQQLFIISGNHETYEGTKTAIDFLKGARKNWMVITPVHDRYGQAPFTYVYKGVPLGFVPYMTRTALGVTSDEEGAELIAARLEETGPHAVVFTHHAISGTKSLGGMTDLFGEIILPRERIEKSTKLLVGGHIHQPSVVGRTIVTGSLLTQDMGETEKSIWKLDFDSMDDPGEIRYTQIPLPVRPIHKVVFSKGTTEEAVEALHALDRTSIVKVINQVKTVDVDTLKEVLREFDGHVLVEDYPSERKRLNVDEKQKLDLSVDSLLDLYAQARNKDPERLKEAFALIKESS